MQGRGLLNYLSLCNGEGSVSAKMKGSDGKMKSHTHLL